MSGEGWPADEIGYWSEVKLDIIREYAAAYSRILSAQRSPSFYHIYVDAFAGAGYHLSRTTGEFVLGSPVNALVLSPPFREYHFIELDPAKATLLRELTKERREELLREGICKAVEVHHGDCNQILPREILPFVGAATTAARSGFLIRTGCTTAGTSSKRPGRRGAWTCFSISPLWT
jgi:three-Cys-motif partner protein